MNSYANACLCTCMRMVTRKCLVCEHNLPKHMFAEVAASSTSSPVAAAMIRAQKAADLLAPLRQYAKIRRQRFHWMQKNMAASTTLWSFHGFWIWLIGKESTSGQSTTC